MSSNLYKWLIEDNTVTLDASYWPSSIRKFSRLSRDIVPPPGLEHWQPEPEFDWSTSLAEMQCCQPAQIFGGFKSLLDYFPPPPAFEYLKPLPLLEHVQSEPSSSWIAPPPGLSCYPLLDDSVYNQPFACITPPPGLEYLQPSFAIEPRFACIPPPPGLPFFHPSQNSGSTKQSVDCHTPPPGFEDFQQSYEKIQSAFEHIHPPPGLEHINPHQSNDILFFDRTHAPPGLEHVVPMPFDPTMIDPTTTPPPGLEHVVPDPFEVFCIGAAIRQHDIDNNSGFVFASDVAVTRDEEGFYPGHITPPPLYQNVLHHAFAY